MRTVSVRWSGGDPGTFTVDVDDEANVSDLKNAIERVTSVRHSRCKLINLRLRGKPATDDAALSSIEKLPKVVMMMGQKEASYEAAREAEARAAIDASNVEDDFEVDAGTTLSVCDNPTYQQKLQRRVENHQMKMIGEPRPGAKCLVLDVDYTLFDHRTTAESARELQRPFLHEFLTRAYRAKFDIFIWSATSLKWIELKMGEMGVLAHEDYKVCGLIDSGAMVTVETPKYGVFNCKPLGYLFAKTWPTGVEYTPKNTIMFDDLSRNFIMNPQLGLKIRPFRNAHTNRATDIELLRLAEYIEALSELDDFSSLNHNRWERYLEKLRKT